MWKEQRASVFKNIAIPELTLFMLLHWWDLIAEKHFVDVCGDLSTTQIAALLKVALAARALVAVAGCVWGMKAG